MRTPRTTGALSGLLIGLLAIWAGLIPFVGPSFHYAFGSYQTWHYTTTRLWLDILPAAVALIAGLMLIASDRRTSGITSAVLGIAAGGWLLVGPSLSALWGHAGIGRPLGGTHRQALEQIGYFYAVGGLIVMLSAFALGRFVSRPRLATDAALAADETVGGRRRRRRFLRRRDREAESEDRTTVLQR